MKAYKGFDKNLKCRGFQYEVGKEYETENAKLCDTGFHACENPLNTLSYYKPGDSRYCEVELDATEERGDDSKRVGKRIKIETEIGLKGLIEAGVKFVFDKCEGVTERAASGESGNAAASGRYGNAAASGRYGNAAASGCHGNAAASGENGNAAASGWYGNAAASGENGNAAASGENGNAAASGCHGNAAASGCHGNAAASGENGNAAASGWYGNAAASGENGNAAASGENGNAAASGCHGNASTKNGVAAAIGFKGKAKGDDVGSYIVLADWRYEKGEWNLHGVEVRKVDGETIKAGVWYTMINRKVVEV